ncbi:MAG: hypothetical protein AAGG44_00020 [Planctomycetota bacterium]
MRQSSCFLLAALALLAGELRAEGLQLQSVVRVPHSRNQPGGILTLEASLVNSTDQVRECTLVSTIDGVQTQQSTRRVTIGPKRAITTDLYVPVPKSIEGKNLVQIKTTLYSRSGGTEVVETNNGRPEEYTFSLGPDSVPSFAALFMDPDPPPKPDWVWPPSRPSMSYEFAIASRVDAGNSRRVANFAGRNVPLSQSDWEVINTAIVADKYILEDAAFVDGLKKFVTSGGKAWVMMDRVPSDLVRPLLGAGQLCETIDEIEMNEFTVEVIGGETPISAEDRTVSSYLPVKMKRVIQNGGRVSHKVDGWPAAIWMPIGYGELLITTLDPAAWVQERAQQVADEKFHTPYESRIWAAILSDDINAVSLDKPLAGDTDYPTKQMGNPIVPKSWVAAALSGFCVLLGVIGVWRAWAGDLSMLGLIAPVVAVVVGIGLVIASTFVRGDQAESVSSLQLVQVADDGDFAMIRENAAVYLEGSSDMALESKADGRAILEGPVATGIQRFEVNSFQDWELANESWPAGIWKYKSGYTLPTENLIVTADFNATGVQLILPTLPSPLEDPVLNYNLGGPMLCQGSGDTLEVRGDQEAAGERWISGTLISTEQQRRLEIYQEFFTPNDRVQGLSKVLYGWTKPWDQGPKWSKSLEQKGSALVALPVQLNRPAPGTPIVVPHGFVEVRRDRTQLGSTFAFSDVTGTWAPDLTMAVNANMQIVLPKEVLPFKADSISIELDIKAPQRDVKLTIVTDSGPITIAELNSPSIPWSGEITDPKIIEEARDGLLSVQLDVSGRKDGGGPGSSVVAWNIENFQASFRGQVEGDAP